MDRERLKKQTDFILELDKEKSIFRQTHLTGHGRNENDAEHAWHMAIMAWLLQEYSNVKVDIAKVMLMCLIHDVVEIDAGDTYAYDSEGLKTQSEREEKAADRIFSILPPDQGEKLRNLFEEFEANETPEARFAHVMDNFQPILLNVSNKGTDWIPHGISASQVRERQKRAQNGSDEIYAYIQELIQKHVDEGHLKNN